jgi:hypothetical protein
MTITHNTNGTVRLQLEDGRSFVFGTELEAYEFILGG